MKLFISTKKARPKTQSKTILGKISPPDESRSVLQVVDHLSGKRDGFCADKWERNKDVVPRSGAVLAQSAGEELKPGTTMRKNFPLVSIFIRKLGVEKDLNGIGGVLKNRQVVVKARKKKKKKTKKNDTG